MKRSLRNIISFKLLRLVVDCIGVLLSIVFAYTLKFKLGWIFQNIFLLDFGVIYDHAHIEPFLRFSFIIVLLWILTFYFTGLYKVFSGLMPEVHEFFKVLKAVTIVVFEITLLVVMFQIMPESRYFLFYLWIFGVLIIYCNRLIILKVEEHLLKNGVGSRKLMVIGEDNIGQDIVEQTLLYPSLAMQYKGTVWCENKVPALQFHLKNEFVSLGNIDMVYETILKHNIDIVFVSKIGLTYCNQEELILFCLKHNIVVHFYSDIYQLSPPFSSLIDYNGMIFNYVDQGLSILKNTFIKRCFDFVFSFIFLLFLSPVLILISIIIKLGSKGPVFYCQERLTQDGQPFKMIKFRTMIVGAEKETGPVMVSENDEYRYHFCGQFLRKSSLDELPQLINVLKGEMSIVGPRPERPFFVEQFSKGLPHFERRHLVKGGLTGWAQVNGRSVLTRKPEQKLKYDLYYIKHWTFLFDIKIILKTIQIVLSRKEAF